jgi:hypothetical protein
MRVIPAEGPLGQEYYGTTTRSLAKSNSQAPQAESTPTRGVKHGANLALWSCSVTTYLLESPESVGVAIQAAVKLKAHAPAPGSIRHIEQSLRQVKREVGDVPRRDGYVER